MKDYQIFVIGVGCSTVPLKNAGGVTGKWISRGRKFAIRGLVEGRLVEEIWRRYSPSRSKERSSKLVEIH